MSTAATIPYYRSYALPWELSFEQEERFRKVLKQVAIALLVFSIIMPLLPVPEADPTAAVEVPPRFARLLLENIGHRLGIDKVSQLVEKRHQAGFGRFLPSVLW
jgi:hypothetical protein